MMNNKRNFFEYLKTFLFTILAVFISVIILLGVIQHQVYEEEYNNAVQDETIDYYLIGVLIEKNKYLEEKYPNDYRINMKLGVLYEIKSDYKNAEIEYKKGIENEPYDDFKPQYRLALMYIKLKRLDDAEALMDNIDEKPQKKLIEYKADIYNKVGDAYYNMADYEDAGDRYQKALFYYKVIHSKQIESVTNALASAYVYFADQEVKNMQIQDAIDSLQMAYSIVKAPILKYKLAILFIKSNPELSYEYFQEVFNEEPNIINYDSYYKFLSQVAAQADAQGYTAKADLCRFKIKKLKEYYSRNILSVQDLAVEYAEGTIKLSRWRKKYNINLELEIKNTSAYNIPSLYLNVIFKDGDQIIDEYKQQIVDQNSVLKPGQVSPTISIKTIKEQNDDDKSPKKITAEVYALKEENGYKVLIKEVTIIENAPRKHHRRLIQNGLIYKLLHLKFRFPFW